MRRHSIIAPALAAAFLFAGSASAGVQLKGVDASAYPTIRASVVTPSPTSKPPQLLENGRPVNALLAENLGRAKSVVLAVDRSQSMKGKPFGDAVAAAQAFLRAKQRNDRVAAATFATTPVLADRVLDLGRRRASRAGGPRGRPEGGHDSLRQPRAVGPGARRRDQCRSRADRGHRWQRDPKRRDARERHRRRTRVGRVRLRGGDRERAVQPRSAEDARPRHRRLLPRCRLEPGAERDLHQHRAGAPAHMARRVPDRGASRRAAPAHGADLGGQGELGARDPRSRRREGRTPCSPRASTAQVRP